MKNKLALIVLAVVCVGLLVGLAVVKNQAGEQKKQDAVIIVNYSNDLVNTSASLNEQRQVTTMLERDVESHKKALAELTNNFTQVSTELSKTTANLAQTQAALKTSQEEVARRDSKITELEAQNQVLDKQALDLSAAITNLTVQIAATEKKLAASEGDKAFLEKELKRLTSEKAELERQFNDLAVLRAQVAKLKEELSIARRIEWIRQGLFASGEQKGAQKLLQGVNTAPAKPVRPSYDLNVEVSSDGSVKVIPPLTNAPAGSAPAR